MKDIHIPYTEDRLLNFDGIAAEWAVVTETDLRNKNKGKTLPKPTKVKKGKKGIEARPSKKALKKGKK